MDGGVSRGRCRRQPHTIRLKTWQNEKAACWHYGNFRCEKQASLVHDVRISPEKKHGEKAKNGVIINTRVRGGGSWTRQPGRTEKKKKKNQAVPVKAGGRRASGSGGVVCFSLVLYDGQVLRFWTVDVVSRFMRKRVSCGTDAVGRMKKR